MSNQDYLRKTWEWIGHLSVAHWLITTVPSLAAALLARWHGLPFEIVILLSSAVFALTMVGLYFRGKREKRQSTIELPSSISYQRLLIPLLAVAVFIFLNAELPPSKSVIHISQVFIYPQLSNGGQEYAPGQEPIANIHFTVTGSEILSNYYASYDVVLLDPLPANWNDRQNTIEDELWDGAQSRHNRDRPKKAEQDSPPPGRDSYITLFGGPISREKIQAITESKAALYLLALFSYQDVLGTHESHVCMYLYGNVGAEHYCHKYNGP